MAWKRSGVRFPIAPQQTPRSGTVSEWSPPGVWCAVAASWVLIGVPSGASEAWEREKVQRWARPAEDGPSSSGPQPSSSTSPVASADPSPVETPSSVVSRSASSTASSTAEPMTNRLTTTAMTAIARHAPTPMRTPRRPDSAQLRPSQHIGREPVASHGAMTLVLWRRRRPGLSDRPQLPGGCAGSVWLRTAPVRMDM